MWPFNMKLREVEHRLAQLDATGRDKVIQSGKCFCSGRIVSRRLGGVIGQPERREVFCRKCGVTYED